jgi:glycosyltransferase involved in cell wall biosynthesis
MSGCVYVTAGWGIHDARWVGALQDIGRVPVVVSLGRDVQDVQELQRAVESAAADGRPVLAGPLDTVTRHLVDTGVRLIGLSWGYDLHDLHRDGADLTWLRRLDGLIVDSDANRAIAVSAGVDAARITFLPWGVDLAVFAFHGPGVDAFQLGVPPHAPLVLSLRAHEAIYRVSDILEAFARVPRPDGLHEDVPDPYLIVGHTGSLTSALRQQAEDLGVTSRIRFIGSVPEPELAPLLTRAACYVTAAEVDGTSVTLLQAMACGTPVVASATPGNLGWIVDGVTGFTFPTGDTAALAAALADVIASYPTRVALRARERVAADADWHANLGRLQRAMDAV